MEDRSGEAGTAEGEPLRESLVLGLDNVAIDLPIAGVGSRVLAAALDYLAQGLLQIAWFIAAASLFSLFRNGKWGWALAGYLGGFFLIDWGYFAGSEIWLGAQTLGKKALRLRVVTRDGGTPDTESLLVRNLVRIVDLLVGVPAMAMDPLARRLGDRLAGTLVIHDDSGGSLVLQRIPEGWGPREVAVVESLLARSREMEAWRVEKLARRVLETVARQHPEFLAGVPEGLAPIDALWRAFDARTS